MLSNRVLLSRTRLPGPYGQDSVVGEVRERLACWYAEQRGFKKDKGNWIRTRDGRPICQGWMELYRRVKDGPLRQEIDRL